MMRRSHAAGFAAWFVACLLFGTLALAPDEASAWWTNQPRYEKQVVTEGDPDGPDLVAPQPGVGGEDGSGAAEIQSAADVLTTLVQTILAVLDAQ